jgi:stage V sporulation protein G
LKITEVRVKIMEDRGDKLQAFCTITLDDAFVIRDLKIIGGSKGVFVAMPSRKLTDRCPKCGGKNHLRAGFCNDCGLRLTADRAARDEHGRAKLHADIAHPINSATREVLQRMVLEAYRAEVERSKQPGYVPPKLYDDDDYAPEFDEHHATPPRGIPRPPLPPAPAPVEIKLPAATVASGAGPLTAPAAAPPAASPAKGERDDFASGIFG